MRLWFHARYDSTREASLSRTHVFFLWTIRKQTEGRGSLVEAGHMHARSGLEYAS